MRGLLVLIALSVAGMLAGSGAALAYGCPPFIVAAGQGSLCSPGAWLEFQHQHNNDGIKKRHHHDFQASKPRKVKYRPRRGGGKAKGK